MKKLLFVPVFIFAISLALAANCTVDKPTSSDDLINNIDKYNSALAACTVQIPSQAKFVLKNGILELDITDKQPVYITIDNGFVTFVSLNSDRSSYKISMDSCVLDEILASPDTIGTFAAYYTSGILGISANGFFGRLKFFFVSPFLKSGLKSVAGTTSGDCENRDETAVTVSGDGGKPENCYETYMEGHEQYQYAKEQWDQWKAETNGVCQTQTAERPQGGNCVYLFEQIKNNDKKWLCWYS